MGRGVYGNTVGAVALLPAGSGFCSLLENDAEGNLGNIPLLRVAKICASPSVDL